MKCPQCATPDLVMAERSGIEIDYCPQCRGVWLDRGELDKIIDRSSSQPTQAAVAPPPPPPMPQQHYKPDDSHYGYQHGKRKKSWLGEIFD